MTLDDAAARHRIATDLDATLIVEAAAGTGKTTALSRRVLALVTSGRARLADVVAVTFTEKAAGELKLRLRADIEIARREAIGDVRPRLDRALAELEAAHIGTIHGFCADLLRERPIEAGIDPLFQVAAEDAQTRLFDEAFDGWFAGALRSPGEGVARVLRRDASPRATLRSAAWELVQQRDFDASWRRDPLDRGAELDGVVDALGRLAELAPDDANSADRLDVLLLEVRREVFEIARAPRDLDRIEVVLRRLAWARGWKHWGKNRAYRNMSRAAVLDLRAATKVRLDEVLARCEADLASLLREELRAVVAAYEAEAARAGAVDFIDLLRKTRDLLRIEPVRAELAERFSHLLVDEFQDTDPLQAEIVLLLAGARDLGGDAPLVPTAGKLFLVGDPKQSIYRFRRADVALYERVKRRLAAGGASVLHLTASFRSAPDIQRVINAAFAPEMLGDDEGIQAAYVPLTPVRAAYSGQPAVVALPVPRPFGGWGKVWNVAIDASLPDAIGAYVDWLVRESGWTVTERSEGARVPIETRHVCLLFKRMMSRGKDLTEPYVRALEARGLSQVLLGGRSYHAREEVQALATALDAIEWPDDELSVYAALRGAFFALSDESLLVWRHAVGSFHTMRPVDRDALPPPCREVADAMAVLGSLHRRRNRRPVADTIGELLDRTRAHAGVAIWPAGEQALSNLMRMMDLARRFEAGAPTSFRAFLDRLRLEAERGGSAEAPVVEEGTDGVRIMSVHKAKGLEFPVVVLCDPTAPPAFERPTRFTDPERGLATMPLANCAPVELTERAAEVLARDHAESVRLAYVAATRARDLLVVPVVSDGPIERSWLAPLSRAVYPNGEGWRAPRPAPGCPPFGWDSALERPPEAGDPERGVAPGGHVGQASADDPAAPLVVWWDPRALGLGRRHVAGLRKESLLAASEDAANEPGALAYAAWVAERERVVADASVPALRVATATALAGDAAPAAAVEIASTDAWDGPSLRASRPHGARFGSLVHAILAEVLLDATDSVLAHRARALGRSLLATDAEIEAAAVAVRSALRHPLLARAFAAGPRREAPVVFARPEGSIVEGVVDLAFREETDRGPAWTVIDFKTDLGPIDPNGRYAAQLALYVEAITAVTGEPATAILLRV